MGCTSTVPKGLPGFAGSGHPPLRNSRNWRTSSPIGSAVLMRAILGAPPSGALRASKFVPDEFVWNARAYWNVMPRTASLSGDAVDDDAMSQLCGHSITYRIAVGPQSGRKVFTLQTLPAGEPEDQVGDTVGKVTGFSLHAGVAVRADEHQKLERLCRYVSRPAVSEKRLSLTSGGNIRYQLKTPLPKMAPPTWSLFRASCPTPYGPAFGCSKSLQAIL